MTLTVTEKGYCHIPATGKLDRCHPDIAHDLASQLPKSAIGYIVRALAKSAQDYYASLKATGSNKAFSDRMHDFDGLNAAIGTPEMLALGKRFDGKS